VPESPASHSPVGPQDSVRRPFLKEPNVHADHRVRRRFGVDPALWHSELSSRTRRDTWRAVAEGEAPVVVGARSALFLPFPELGLIVVDEEHETAFKQEEGVVYHARDMAVVRARLSNAACVLVSATPSLESLTNVEAGRYAAHERKKR